MAPPADSVTTWPQGSQACHPKPALFVASGAKFTNLVFAGGEFRMAPLIVNIHAILDRSDGDKLYFCKETVVNGKVTATGAWDDSVATVTHTWMAADVYQAQHSALHREWDCDANFEFNVNGGWRDPGGAPRRGSNKLMDADGTLHIDEIRANCP